MHSFRDFFENPISFRNMFQWFLQEIVSHSSSDYFRKCFSDFVHLYLPEVSSAVLSEFSSEHPPRIHTEIYLWIFSKNSFVRLFCSNSFINLSVVYIKRVSFINLFRVIFFRNSSRKFALNTFPKKEPPTSSTFNPWKISAVIFVYFSGDISEWITGAVPKRNLLGTSSVTNDKNS